MTMRQSHAALTLALAVILSHFRQSNATEGTYPNECTGRLEYHSTRLKWEQARDYCRDNGGEFPSIHHFAREDQVRDAATNYEEFWVGYRTHEDVWNTTWSDGSPFGYSRWGTSHPQVNECGVFNPNDDRWWWDRPCGDKVAFVCCYPESGIKTPSPTKAPTPYPTKAPTPYPTKAPTAYPTAYPTYGTEAPTPPPEPQNPYCPYECFYRFKHPKVPNMPLPYPGQGDKVLNYGNPITYDNGQTANGCNGEHTEYYDNGHWRTAYYDNDGHSKNVSNVFYASGPGELKVRNIQTWMSPSLMDTLNNKLVRTQITCEDPYAHLLSEGSASGAQLMTPGISGCIIYTVKGYHPCQDYHPY